MKPNPTKSIPYAVFLSIGLHIVLTVCLSLLYQTKPTQISDVTQFDILHVPTQRSRRTLKRDRYVPKKYTPVPQNQVESIATSPVVSAQPTTPISHTNPVTPVRDYTLPSPRTLGETLYNGSSTVPAVGSNPVNRHGTVATNLQAITRSAKVTSYKPSINYIFPKVSDLPLPIVLLERIGNHIVSHRQSDIMDIVFIVDGSGSMKDNINAVRSHLNSMTKIFDDAGVDFTLGIVVFRDSATYSMLGWDFEVVPQTKSVREIKKALSRIKCKGGEKALDALIRAADEVEFRQNSEAHFILVTDEYVSGTYTATDVLTKMRRNKIQVDVIGLQEPFHGFITRRTGGIWLPISSLGAQ
ncbi:VWA domain-containing protein [Candidatus Poribacteria bacterium]|nr:VWA domain-containing protein [Candidatus Poribacteria bacterium]